MDANRGNAAVRMSGGCQCGNVRYEITGAPVELVVCHCKECQRQSGSGFGMSLFVADGGFRLTAGELKFFHVTCDSGRLKTCAFCGDCGTRIYHSTGGSISLKPGTLDDTAWLRPTHHYWTQRKQPWVVIPDDAVCIADDG
jgi:hypothetical protein